MSPDGHPIVRVETLWHAIMTGLAGVWPATATVIDGQSMGDVWPCEALAKANATSDTSHLVPFHKLSQWLTYSLIEPMQTLYRIEFIDLELMTGLPEYRNGECMSCCLIISLTSD
jgi:hypothetical protein